MKMPKLEASKPYRTLLLCAATLITGAALGFTATKPGVAKVQEGILMVAQAESAKLVKQTQVRRDNLPLVFQALKDRPDAVAALSLILSTDHSQEDAQKVVAGLYEASMGIASIRHPWLGIVDLPSGDARVRALHAELDAEFFAKTGQHLSNGSSK